MEIMLGERVRPDARTEKTAQHAISKNDLYTNKEIHNNILNIYTYIYIYIYIYIHINVYIYIYIYILASACDRTRGLVVVLGSC